MNYKCFTFLLCTITSSFFAQQVFKGRLIDKASNAPVEFANIGLVGKGVGTVSDDKGAFSFIVPDSLAAEPVKVSMIGYETKDLTAKDFKQEATIYLTPVVTQLNEVQVSATKTKLKMLGNETTTTHLQAGFKKNSLGAELAVKLNIKHHDTQLRKFFVNINKNTLGPPVFRINVYNADEKGHPKQNILKQNIIITPTTATGMVQVDLTPYNIVVSDDVFVSLEWIKDLGDVTGLMFSTKLVGSPVYFRQASQDKWEKAPVGVGLHVEVAY